VFGTTKEIGSRVLGGKMGMRMSRMAEKDKRISWLIGRGRLQGKYKDYTAGKSRKHLEKKESRELKMGGYQRW
jgi:hypothetical protein